MSLPTLDETLNKEKDLTAAYHVRRSAGAAFGVTVVAVVVAAIEAAGRLALYSGGASKVVATIAHTFALPSFVQTAVQPISAMVSLALPSDGAGNKAAVSAVIAILSIAASAGGGWFFASRVRREDTRIDSKFANTQKLYEVDMENHADHARQHIKQDRLEDHDVKHICDVLENHIYTRIKSIYKLSLRRFVVAAAAAGPWAAATFPLLAFAAVTSLATGVWTLRFQGEVGAVFAPWGAFAVAFYMSAYKTDRARRNFDRKAWRFQYVQTA